MISGLLSLFPLTCLPPRVVCSRELPTNGPRVIRLSRRKTKRFSPPAELSNYSRSARRFSAKALDRPESFDAGQHSPNSRNVVVEIQLDTRRVLLYSVYVQRRLPAHKHGFRASTGHRVRTVVIRTFIIAITATTRVDSGRPRGTRTSRITNCSDSSDRAHHNVYTWCGAQYIELLVGGNYVSARWNAVRRKPSR